MGHELIFTCDRCAKKENAKNEGLEGTSRLPEGWIAAADPRNLLVIPWRGNVTQFDQAGAPRKAIELCGSCWEMMDIVTALAGDRFMALIQKAFEDPEWQPTRMERDKVMRLKERAEL